MGSKLSPARRLQALAGVGCLALALASQLPAAAAPGPGTHTRVTSPGNGTVFLSHVGHEGTLTVRGTTSPDVADVNVYCLRGSGSAVQATTVATAVHVSGGAFHATVPVPGSVGLPQCRLRALPSAVSPQTGYLSSYAGPIVNLDYWQAGATDFQLTASTGSAFVTASSLGSCSTDYLAPVAADQTVPGASGGCLLSLSQNAAGSRAGVVVDGHPALLPAEAARFGVTPRSSVHATFHTIKGGAVRWTDTEALDRCPTSGAFPPPASCSLKPTGVEVRQVATLLGSGQVRLRAGFRSVDGRRHILRLAYDNVISPVTPAQLGLRFPGQKSFHAAQAGRKLTHLGHGSGTLLARTDRFAGEGDPTIATRALSWSRTPRRILFAPTNATRFELDYRLVVPKGGAVHLGFGDGASALTTGAKALGARGERDMMPAPAIVGPRNGAVIPGRKTTVAGVVYAGANGPATSVRVNGHRVKLKRAKHHAYEVFTYVFKESLGRHTIKVVSQDAAGNTRSASVRVRNK